MSQDISPDYGEDWYCVECGDALPPSSHDGLCWECRRDLREDEADRALDRELEARHEGEEI